MSLRAIAKSWRLIRQKLKPEPYGDLTRKEIVERLARLESRHSNEAQAAVCVEERRRPYDFSQVQQQRVAFKVAYLGWDYYGFTSSHKEDEFPSVQGKLVEALRKCKLIQDLSTCEFSLCGRTDTGVSGLGQVIALNVRRSSNNNNELPYLAMLNRQLPDDIRVWAWAPVPPEFNARFACQSRTYHYYIPTDGLDLEAMQQAAKHFLGHQDFRHFCKFNPAKNVKDYRRTIYAADIRPVTSTFGRIEVTGSAFLWHQVRCMVSILLLVGQRLEKPEIVKDLLDVDRITGKPQYPLASPHPLVLHGCAYDNIDWRVEETTSRTRDHWRARWSEQMTRALLFESFANALEDKKSEKVTKIFLGAAKEIWTKDYVPLLERQRAEPNSVKQEKYLSRKGGVK